jgi:hypothetical protein
MRCPKCDTITFDYLKQCPKCGKDLSEIAGMLGTFHIPDTSFDWFNLNAEMTPANGPEQATAPELSDDGLQETPPSVLEDIDISDLVPEQAEEFDLPDEVMEDIDIGEDDIEEIEIGDDLDKLLDEVIE